MIVESKAGGIDIYSQPDLEATKLNDEQIPNGTALHIEGEVEDTENNRTWGYTEYHGMYGYAPLDECRPADSRKEAIDSEIFWICSSFFSITDFSPEEKLFRKS